MKSINILLLFSFLGFNTCQSKTVMQSKDSVTYSLCVDFIESINFNINNDVIIKLNNKGLQEIQSVNFENYNYFTIDSCSFKALILPYTVAFRPQEPIVPIWENNTIIHKENISLDISHLKVEEVEKYKKELLKLFQFNHATQ